MQTPTYRDAIQWIAANDNPGDAEPLEAVAAYLTVALVADLFGVTPDRVAADVIKARAQNG